MIGYGLVKTSGIHGVSQKPKNVGTLNVNIRPFQWWSIEILDTRFAGEQLSSLGLLNPQWSTYHFVDITPTSEYMNKSGSFFITVLMANETCD